MKRIALMIRDGVREEVREAVQPIEERLGMQEKTTQGMNVQIKTLMTEIQTLKGEVASIKDFPLLPKPGAQRVSSGGVLAAGRASEGVGVGNDLLGQLVEDNMN